jgi:ubiquinone biosynthesis protein COQ4
VYALQQIAQRMRNDSVGRQILDDRPRITVRHICSVLQEPLAAVFPAEDSCGLCASQDETLAICRQLPAHTFGGAYAQFMGDRGFAASERPPVRWVGTLYQEEASAHQLPELSLWPCPGYVNRAAVVSLRFVADEELAYIICRMREVHDLWHVLFGCHTNVFGELALKAMEFVQVSERACDLPTPGLPSRGSSRQLSSLSPWYACVNVAGLMLTEVGLTG